MGIWQKMGEVIQLVTGSFLVVQRLGLGAFTARVQVPSLVGDLRPLKLRGTAPLPHAHRPQIPEIKQGKLPFWSVKTFVSESDGGWWTWKDLEEGVSLSLSPGGLCCWGF